MWEMIIDRDDYYIRDLEEKDRLQLLNWKDYEDPLLYGYNYSDMTEDELYYWYNTKQFPFRARYFSVFNHDDVMIAYLGMKEINRFTKSSKLGIVINSQYTSKGYGTRILGDFLDYYFNHLDMRRMILEVNAWNERAIKLYESFGFIYYNERYDRFENQSIDLDETRYDKVRDCFEERSTGIYNRILKMSLTRAEYERGKDEN